MCKYYALFLYQQGWKHPLNPLDKSDCKYNANLKKRLKEHSKRSKNNGDMVNKAERDVVCEGVSGSVSDI